MVVNCNTSTECSSATHMEHSSLSHPELLIAKREPGTADSSKRCRPVSAKSALEPVDEEPSVADGKQKGAAMTVDRGVGPTPVPPNMAADSTLPNRKHFTSPYLPTSPLEQSAYQQSLAYYYAAAQVAGISPIGFSSPSPVGQPLSANTHEGRYFFNHANFHHPSPARMVGSPTQSDISLFSNPALANSMDRLAAQLHWDRSQKHLQQMGSPFNLGDISKKSSASGEIPVTPQSGSITLPPSLNSSRLTSPRPSLVGGKGRKRALSHSPLSEFLDIQSLTRSSEGSLHFTPLLHNSNSRSSSAASGSYGHLSAGSLASLTPTLKSGSPFLHAAAALYPGLQLPFPVPPFQPPTAMHMTPASIAQQQLLSQQINSSHVKQEDMVREAHKQHEKGDGSTVVSSTVPAIDEQQPGSVASTAAKRDAEDEQQDFKETCCRWEECTQQFLAHEDLVKHVNQDHINSNRKAFICRWRDCCRQEKPFKAQYMLVVHMRRHTGEKPHKCQGFPGCNKAYSRLENLKTHMRSHTGERPYLCEYPGCQKAFSNASDRAKHQNRTHSNEKPYACEIDGCSKRYTDPSSLRKHVKTVHGAEFYARKKHKGLDTPGCRNNSFNGKSDNTEPGRKNGVEECLTVTRLGNDRRVSQNAAPIATDEQGSPHSDIDVGVNMMKEENVVLAHSPMEALQEAGEDGDSYQQRGEGQSILIGRASQRLNTLNLRAKQISSKSTAVTSLPSIPDVFLGGQKTKSGSGLTAPQESSRTAGRRQLPEIIEPSGQKQTRRDSNTSTLSSYMSSLKSDVSPAMYNSRFSSRRSSETSRLSIINSPYEYDMAGNLPDRTSKELNSVTDQMERAKLGSQPNLFVQSQSMNLLSPLARREGLRRDVGYRRGRENEGWRTATPAHTPLPHEYPQYERRRASDPVRCVDPNFSELKKLQQRYYSLNAVKPLPIPNNMKSLRTKHLSYDTVQSSHSSVYTNGYDNGGTDLEENNLNMKMIEDNDDVIIPDDMRQFLQQRQFEQHNRVDIPQGGITPAVTAASFNNAVESWVQQTASNIPQCHDKQSSGYGYPPQCTPPYPDHYQYGAPLYDHQHACCNSGPYANAHHGQRYTNFAGPHHGSYQCHPTNPPNRMCYASHPTAEMHQLSGCHPASYNQTPLMPPPHSSSVAPPHRHQGQVGGVPMNQPPAPQYHSSPYNNYNLNTNRHPVAKAPQTRHALLSQQLSPPCEVSSSTDHDSQNVRDAVNLPDNMSSISGANGHSHASHNFSSVSQTQPIADATCNLVINNMSNVLSQFNEENKYLNNQH